MGFRARVAVVVIAAVATAGAGAAPVQADEPRDSDGLPRLIVPRPHDFAAQAEELPEGLVAAVQRDLGLDAEEYLARAELANDAAELVAALIEAGVGVNGGELDGDEVTIYVDSSADTAAVESTGATAVVGERETEPVPDVEALGDLYGGAGWGYQISSTGMTACSLGFPGYNANGDDVIATAGHCFGIESSPTGISQYSSRWADPQQLDYNRPRQFGGTKSNGDWIGTLVAGSKEFGNGRDVGLLATGYSKAIVRPQVAQWGSTGEEDGQGAPLATSFQLTGTTAGVAGAPICKSGITTGWTCGEVIAVDTTVSVSGQQVNSITSTACMLPGDSGGVAVIGTEAVGINSGGNFATPPAGQDCLPGTTGETGNGRISVFFHMVDPGLDGDNRSVVQKYGSSWTLCTGPVPFVSSLKPGGDPAGPIPLKGKVPCAVAGVTTTVKLYLDGSATPHATAKPSGTSGAFEFSLAGIPVGVHDYEIVVSWSGNDSPPATGSFRIFNASSLPGRLAGSDRYATAAAIAGEWDQSFDADIVFVATGENYPDALSAAAAAAYLGAPVLLTKKNSLPSVVKSRLNALKPDRIVVLGSTAAISTKVLNALKTVSGSPKVTRISGSDRYETARKIVQYAFAEGGGLVDVPSVVIATGENFPDALSAAPGVARDGGAVILVDGSKSSIPSATLSIIRDLDPDRIIIAGSTKVVKAGIEDQLKKLYGGLVERAAGSDRHQTSRLLTDRFWGDAPAVFFAVGDNYPDALTGAALAGALGAPLLVTKKSCMPSQMRSLVNALDAEERVLLGSSKVISGSVASLKTC